jgi:hypothetical protein
MGGAHAPTRGADSGPVGSYATTARPRYVHASRSGFRMCTFTGISRNVCASRPSGRVGTTHQTAISQGGVPPRACDGVWEVIRTHRLAASPPWQAQRGEPALASGWVGARHRRQRPCRLTSSRNASACAPPMPSCSSALTMMLLFECEARRERRETSGVQTSRVTSSP